MVRLTIDQDVLTALNAAGEQKLFVYRAMKNPSTIGSNPWVLLTELDETDAIAMLTALREELMLIAIVLIMGSLLIAQQVADDIVEKAEVTSDEDLKHYGKGNQKQA